MDNIKTTIKRLRKEKHLTHKSMGERLNMARSTYSKLESGETKLDCTILVNISKVLDVPLSDIIKENGDPVFKSFSAELDLMLLQTEYWLSQMKYSMIPFSKLTTEHIKLLKEKGFNTKEDYENTPLGGRIYDFGPRDLFRFMVENCGMSVLFERSLITNEHWKKRWNNYLKSKEKISINFNKVEDFVYEDKNEVQVDDHDYFLVYIFQLKFSGGKEQYFQLAERNFPEGADEFDALELIKLKTGALDGDIVCFTTDGYDPVTDIFVND
jgi:transcriptional regulator with XRE-family HTH domain